MKQRVFLWYDYGQITILDSASFLHNKLNYEVV